jgi:hypothetical protein
MSGDTATRVVEDFFGVVRLFSDGSVVRVDQSVVMPAETVPVPDVPGVQWKEVVYDATRSLKVRIYRPSAAAASEGGNKLPVFVYFHGGGYCIGSYNQPGIPDLLRQRVAAELPAFVLSVQYRLAPEHRLPAAIEDGAAFLSWLSGQAALGAGADPWLAESADFSRTFVSGVSAGANLAHHVVVQASSVPFVPDTPVRVAGYVLLSAFFGSGERVDTESDPPADVFDGRDGGPALAHGAAGGRHEGPPGGEPVRHWNRWRCRRCSLWRPSSTCFVATCCATRRG